MLDRDKMRRLEREIEAHTTPEKESIFRMLKKQAVWSFVQYMKEQCPGKVNPDMTVILDAMSYTQLDKIAEEFICK